MGRKIINRKNIGIWFSKDPVKAARIALYAHEMNKSATWVAREIAEQFGHHKARSGEDSIMTTIRTGSIRLRRKKTCG